MNDRMCCGQKSTKMLRFLLWYFLNYAVICWKVLSPPNFIGGWMQDSYCKINCHSILIIKTKYDKLMYNNIDKELKPIGKSNLLLK